MENLQTDQGFSRVTLGPEPESQNLKALNLDPGPWTLRRLVARVSLLQRYLAYGGESFPRAPNSVKQIHFSIFYGSTKELFTGFKS